MHLCLYYIDVVMIVFNKLFKFFKNFYNIVYLFKMYFNLPRIFLLIISVFFLATFSYWICQQCLQTKLLNLHVIFSPSVVMFLFLWNNNCVTLWTTCVNYKWKTEHTQAQNMHAKKRTKPPIIKLFVPNFFFSWYSTYLL